MKNYNHKRRAGFTLIELMIVVGIIVVLMAVLAIAIMPWLRKSDEKATRTLLLNIGPQITGGKVAPSIKKFKKDAGSLSSKISSDKKFASSQMMLFYTAPTRETWDSAKCYKDQNYNPPQQPQQYAEFTQTDKGLPYLVDAWGTCIWYEYDKTVKAGFVFSEGEDMQWNTPDDLIYDSRNNKVSRRDELVPAK
jgi:prepilin-type N-terminal cleavage/methylation domain-containing protein